MEPTRGSTYKPVAVEDLFPDRGEMESYVVTNTPGLESALENEVAPAMASNNELFEQYGVKLPDGVMDKAEMMPIEEVKKYIEFDRAGEDRITSEAAFDKLTEDIRKYGITMPLMLSWSNDDGYAYLGEGHHRLIAAERLGLDKVPVFVVRNASKFGPEHRYKGRNSVYVGDYVGDETDALGEPRAPQTMSPSDVGLEGTPVPEAPVGLDKGVLIQETYTYKRFYDALEKLLSNPEASEEDANKTLRELKYVLANARGGRSFDRTKTGFTEYLDAMRERGLPDDLAWDVMANNNAIVAGLEKAKAQLEGMIERRQERRVVPVKMSDEEFEEFAALDDVEVGWTHDDLLRVEDDLYLAKAEGDGVTLEKINTDDVKFKNGRTVHVFDYNDKTYLMDDEEGLDNAQEAHEWLREVGSNAWEYVGELDFNKDFWESPEGVFHATKVDHIQDILEHGGLETRNESRGLTNTDIGAAVFTSTNPEIGNSYGNFTFEIDTQKMREDGVMPDVQMDGDFQEMEEQRLLASMLGIYDFYPDEPYDGTDQSTVVFTEDIPLEYIKLSGLSDEEWQEFLRMTPEDQEDIIYGLDRGEGFSSINLSKLPLPEEFNIRKDTEPNLMGMTYNAYDGDYKIGSITIEPAGADVGIIRNITVDEDYRRRGVASSLLREAQIDQYERTIIHSDPDRRTEDGKEWVDRIEAREALFSELSSEQWALFLSLPTNIKAALMSLIAQGKAFDAAIEELL